MADINISFDLETLGVRSNSRILSIAAAARLPSGELATFYQHVNQDAQIEMGRQANEDTLAWWRSQPDDLFVKTLHATVAAKPLPEVLADLSRWYSDIGDHQDRLFPWGNGSGFDITMLEDAFADCNTKAPWAFWTARDLRTLKALAQDLGINPTVPRHGTHHDALDDAITQLHTVERCQRLIREKCNVESAAAV